MIRVSDILNLQKTGSIILGRTGLGMTETGNHFSERMKELIIRSFYLLCLDKDEQNNLTKDQLPPMEKMCSELEKINQSTVLPKYAQAAYYCAVAILLTMEGHDEEARVSQYARARMLINAKVFPY